MGHLLILWPIGGKWPVSDNREILNDSNVSTNIGSIDVKIRAFSDQMYDLLRDLYDIIMSHEL